VTFITIPNTVEVEFRMLWNGVNVENTLYFQTTSTITLATLGNLVNTLDAYWVAEHLTRMASSVLYVSTKARDLSAQAGLSVEYFGSAGIAGGNSNPSMPNNVTWAVKFVAGLTGRAYRGRNYVIGLTEADSAGNSINSGTANAITADYALLLTTAKPAGWDWVIASRFLNNAPRSTGIATNVTGVGYADLRIDTQRKRMS